MQTFIPSKEDLKEVVSKAVEKAVMKQLPEIIYKATRKKYYTVQEASELLSVSTRHIYHLKSTKQIGYIKSGNKIYFKVEDIEAFFDENYIASDKQAGGTK